MDHTTRRKVDCWQADQDVFNWNTKSLSRDNSPLTDCASITSSSSYDSPILGMEHEMSDFNFLTSIENESYNSDCDPVSQFLCELFGEDQEGEEKEEKPSSASDQSLQCSRRTANAKRKRVQIAPSLPRIVKRDIRREMGKMYANAVNSADKELIAAFSRQFCVPHFSSTDVFIHPDNPSNVVRKHIHGVGNFIKWVCRHVERSPDMSIQFSNIQIYRQAGVPGCRILMRALLSGTVVFKPDEGTTDTIDTRFSALFLSCVHYSTQNTFIMTLDAENRIIDIQSMVENTLPSGIPA